MLMTASWSGDTYPNMADVYDASSGSEAAENQVGTA
jgi:hypothetical protein